MSTKNKLFSAFLFLFSCLWVAPSFAALTEEEERAAFQQLLESPDQPLIHETLKAFGGQWPTLNEFYRGDLSYAKLPPKTLREMARVIAVVEHVYPGATMMTLGRDAQIFGTWFEAFWVSIGRFDRRAQLAASGNSFVRDNYPINSRFMLDSGVEIFDSEKKYLIYDSTSYHDLSQARCLLRSLYWFWLKEKRDPRELVKRINVASFSSGYGNNTFDGTSSKSKVSGYFRRQANIVSSSEFSLEAPPTPSEMLSLPTGSMPVSHGYEWHTGYSTVEEQIDGKVKGLPKTPADETTRIRMLKEQIVLFRHVSTPAFLRMVREEAQKLGYQFPVPADVVPLPVKVTKPQLVTSAELKNELKALADTCSQYYYGNPEKSLSVNGKSVATWLADAFQRTEHVNSIVTTLMEGFLQMENKNGISSADLTILVARTIAKADFNDKLFVRKLRTFFVKHKRIREIFSQNQRALFEKTGVNATKGFDWVFENIIKPQGWDCENDLLAETDTSGAA